MALNVKNRETEEAVRELMRLTGEGQAQAIERAARERIERIRKSRAGSALEDLLAQLHADFAGVPLSTDALYDERGLPVR